MAQTIKHVVVLMLENRSFDHVLGYLRSAKYPIDGLTGKESNPLDPHHPSQEIKVTANAEDVLELDPGHEFSDVNMQLFANPSGPPPAGETNSGFIFNYAQQQGAGPPDPTVIMRCFAPERLPVITRLAREFAVCDQWFSSVPGPTWPNRVFAHCATSKGYLDNNWHYYDMPSIFEKLGENGQTWKIYFHDFAQATILQGLNEPENKANFFYYKSFAYDAKHNGLPNYAFIEPRYFGANANDQHPPHDMQLGEALIADVYNTLRNSAAWNETLLLIVYDEHGGTYDHRLPPPAIPPDEHTGQFAFDRYGLRVPAVIISPYVPKGTIVSDLFDHTSIPATLRELFGLKDALTARDKAARSFATVASLAAPRADTPVDVTAPDPATLKVAAVRRAQPTPIRKMRRSTLSTPAAKTSRKTTSRPLSASQRCLLELANAVQASPGKRKTGAAARSPINSERAAIQHVKQVMATFLATAKTTPSLRKTHKARKK